MVTSPLSVLPTNRPSSVRAMSSFTALNARSTFPTPRRCSSARIADPRSASSAAWRLRLFSSTKSFTRRSSCSRRFRSSCNSVLYAGSALACCTRVNSSTTCRTRPGTSTCSGADAALSFGSSMVLLSLARCSDGAVDFVRDLVLDILPQVTEVLERGRNRPLHRSIEPKRGEPWTIQRITPHRRPNMLTYPAWYGTWLRNLLACNKPRPSRHTKPNCTTNENAASNWNGG